MEIDLGAELGTTEEFSTQRLTLFIPNKDRIGCKLKSHRRWVKEARELLSNIGGGSTAFPPADGTWVGDKGKVIWEQTTMVFCYTLPDGFRAHLSDLREFVHHFGRKTNQGEVVVEFDGRFFRIKEFDGARDETS
jgi:hypothetical protein